MRSRYEYQRRTEELVNYKASRMNLQKSAIILAHFGTTVEEARQEAYIPLNTEVQALYPDIIFRECYTSRIILKKLKDRGTPMPSLPDVFEDLLKEEAQNIIIQPSVVIDGVEMESIMHDIASYAPLFSEIRVSTPLLYHPSDYYDLAEILRNSEPHKDRTTIYIGHGTYDSSTAQYCMLQQVMFQLGYDNSIISTIEGYPNMDDILPLLRRLGNKKVLLRPLMYVAGVHTRDDINEEWRNTLTEKGYDVEVDYTGMGENKEVRDLYLRKLAFHFTHQPWHIMEKKAIYINTGAKIHSTLD